MLRARLKATGAADRPVSRRPCRRKLDRLSALRKEAAFERVQIISRQLISLA
jgi:hypothetical protein